MSSLTLIDTHCHLDFPEFDADREQVLERAERAGIKQIIVPAVSRSTWQRTINMCKQYSSLKLALGLHPIFIDQHQPQHLLELNDLVDQHKPIAIGEIGLDFYSKELDREKQLTFFTKQMIIASQQQLPTIIHNRKAHDECISIIRETGVRKGIIHAFNGSIQHAEKYTELGFLLGFGGMLTYQRSNKLRKLCEAISMESIVLETDAPDMTVSQHRGKRNSPEYLPFIAQAVAEIKQLPIRQVAKSSNDSVRQLFELAI